MPVCSPQVIFGVKLDKPIASAVTLLIAHQPGRDDFAIPAVEHGRGAV